MPVSDCHFDPRGVFFCRQSGRIDTDDAKYWVEQASQYTIPAQRPIAAFVDAQEVQSVTYGARKVLRDASHLPNLAFSVVVVQRPLVIQSVRVVALMSKQEHTFVFTDLQEATQFLHQRLQTVRQQQAWHG